MLTPNNLTLFIVTNVVQGFNQASLTFLSQLSDAKSAYMSTNNLLNILLKTIPCSLMIIFIFIYFYFLFSTNRANLRLLSIFLQVPDQLIEKKIIKIKKLLVIIKKTLYEGKGSEITQAQLPPASKSKTIYRKKLFKNHKDICNLYLLFIILLPIVLMAGYNVADYFITAQFMNNADFLLDNCNLASTELSILSDYNTLLQANLPYSILVNGTSPSIIIQSSGIILTQTINTMFYNFVRGSAIFSESYSNVFSQAFFGAVCSVPQIYNQQNVSQVSTCARRYAYFGMQAISGLLNVLELNFFTLQNTTNFVRSNSSFVPFFALSFLKR